MQTEVYEYIVEKLGEPDAQESVVARDPFLVDQNVRFETVLAIFYQNVQQRTKPLFRALQQRREETYERWECGETIASISDDVNIADCLVARVVLGCWYERHETGNAKERANRAMLDPTLITDPRLREQVEDAIVCDRHYSPDVARLKRLMGLEYEYRLQQCVSMLEVPVVTEDQMQQRGWAKTPDIALEVPILVDGCPVNWIESKATFGDANQMQRDAKQFFGYQNRMGPGLVVYWFGFLAHSAAMFDETTILVSHGFPDQSRIQFLSPPSSRVADAADQRKHAESHSAP